MSEQLLNESQKEIIAIQHGEEVKKALKPMMELGAEFLNSDNMLGLSLLLESCQALCLEMIEKGMAIQAAREPGDDMDLSSIIKEVKF
jgi:hypothetical protein